MDALEAGETLIITRRGVDVGELRPLPRGTFVKTSDVKKSLARLHKVDYAAMREEADAFFGPDLVAE